VAAAGVQYPDFQHRRPPAQSRFLYAGQEGWRLSPAYDLNPVPTDIKPRILSTAINEDDNTASLALAMEVAGYFELDDRRGPRDSKAGRQGRLEVAR
jgi:serine/threonine-protein kinase HipA